MEEEYLISYSTVLNGEHSIPKLFTLVLKEDGNNLGLVCSKKSEVSSDASCDAKDVSPFIKLNSTMIAHRDPHGRGPDAFRYVRFYNVGMCNTCWNELQGHQIKHGFQMFTLAERGINPAYPDVDLLSEYPKQHEIVEQESQEVRDAVQLVLEANPDALPTAKDYDRYLFCLRRSLDRFTSYIQINFYEETVGAIMNSMDSFNEQYHFAQNPGLVEHSRVLVQLTFERAQEMFDYEIRTIIRELKRARAW